jgi:hypothetical protein
MCVRGVRSWVLQALRKSLCARITVGEFHSISQHYQEGCIFILHVHIFKKFQILPALAGSTDVSYPLIESTDISTSSSLSSLFILLYFCMRKTAASKALMWWSQAYLITNTLPEHRLFLPNKFPSFPWEKHSVHWLYTAFLILAIFKFSI